MLYRCLRADFQKIKHTPFIWIHFIVPSLYAITFLLYLSGRKMPDQLHLYTGYIETMAVIMPLFIALLCSIVISQEENAGEFQVVRGGAISRSTKCISQIIMLVLMAVFSVFLSISIFVLGLKYILGVSNITYVVFFQGGLWIIVGSIILYLIHLFVSYAFGMGFSTLLGGVGVLVTALMVTGLGDKAWKYVPWGWGVRFSDIIGVIHFGKIESAVTFYLMDEMLIAKLILVSTTIIVFFISVLWFTRWEGRKLYE